MRLSVRSAWRTAAVTSLDVTPSSRARFCSSDAQAGADRTMRTASASSRPRVSTYPFAQVQQMPARLHLTRPSQVGRFDPQSVEWIPAVDDVVIGEDRAELEREHVERARKLAGRQHQRASQGRRHATSVMRDAQPRRSSAVSVSTMASMCVSTGSWWPWPLCPLSCSAAYPACPPYRHERLKTVAKHFTQVAFKPLHRGKSVCHLSIINECACAS